MKTYRFFPQEENMCLASCIQSVLDSRKLKYPEQKIISQRFYTSNRGVNLDEHLLNKFFEDYNLKSQYVSPFETILEPDLLIKSFPESSDILVFYDLGKLQRLEIEAGHFSILADFREGQEREVYLHDNLTQKIEQVSLPGLINSMRTFRNCGFYVIH